MMTGKHLIGGAWVSGAETFLSSPADGEARAFSFGTPADVAAACEAAEAVNQRAKVAHLGGL